MQRRLRASAPERATPRIPRTRFPEWALSGRMTGAALAAVTAASLATMASATVPVPANAQDPPTRIAATTESSGEIVVPLRFEGGRLIVTATGSDGAPLDLVLSTANGITLLSESTAARLGDAPRITLGAGDPAGPTTDVVMDGHQTLPDRALRMAGHDYDGILGANTSSRFDLLADPVAGRLTLKSIGPRVSWPGVALTDPIRLRLYHGIAIGLDVDIDGTEYLATLDLGTPGLLVNEPVRAALGLAPEDHASVRLGTVTLADAPVSVSDHVLFERWDPTGRGFVLVGAAIADGCAVAVSWVHQELRMCVR